MLYKSGYMFTLFSGELCLRLHTDPVMGLTPEKAKEILQQTGPNKLTPARKTPECLKYIKTLTHGMFKNPFALGA